MKQRAISLAAVFLWAATGFADQSQMQVVGMVRSASTGEALKSAIVTLTGRDAKQKLSRTTTGSDGSFGFAGLPPGQYQLTVRKPGYQTIQGNSPVTILGDSAEVTRLTATLWPNGSIYGRVADWDGEPVSEAQVRAYAVVYQSTGITLSLAAQGESDDLGEYRLFDLPAGKYVVQVSPPRTPTPSGQFYATTPVMYYPGVAAPSQALPLELNWGQDVTQADVKISHGQSYGIGGVAWDAVAEGPCTRCVVTVMQRDGPYRVSLPQTTRVSRTGAFALGGLSPGDYSLVVRNGSTNGAVAQTHVTLRDRNVDDARLVVGLQQPVTGQLVIENAPEGFDASGLSPHLSPVAMPEKWPTADGKVEAGRKFTIEGVSPARYRFELSGLTAGAYLKALRFGGQPLASTEINVPTEAPVSGLEAVVGFDGSTVNGKVRSAENAEFVQARVSLLPQTGGQPKTTETAADGSFNFGSVAPGSYTLYALPSTTALQIFDPAVQATLGRYAKQINLDPKQTVNVELSLAPQLK